MCWSFAASGAIAGRSFSPSLPRRAAERRSPALLLLVGLAVQVVYPRVRVRERPTTRSRVLEYALRGRMLHVRSESHHWIKLLEGEEKRRPAREGGGSQSHTTKREHRERVWAMAASAAETPCWTAFSLEENGLMCRLPHATMPKLRFSMRFLLCLLHGRRLCAEA